MVEEKLDFYRNILKNIVVKCCSHKGYTLNTSETTKGMGMANALDGIV